MNEYFAVEPTAFETANELKFFLERFGPATGRYLTRYPDASWRDKILDHLNTLRPVEAHRFKQLLIRAAENWAIVADTERRSFDEGKSWVANVARIQQKASPPFDDVVVARTSAGFKNLDDLHLDPIAAESIASTREEFVRVARLLLQRAEELFFVDPYFNPAKQGHREVLQAMLQAMPGTTRRKTVHVWISDSKLEASGHSHDEVARELSLTARAAGYRSPYQLTFCRFAEGSAYRIHDRYLLCKAGAIRFEHGFQRSRGTQPTKVEPVAPKIHRELLEIHANDKYHLLVGSDKVALS